MRNFNFSDTEQDMNISQLFKEEPVFGENLTNLSESVTENKKVSPKRLNIFKKTPVHVFENKKEENKIEVDLKRELEDASDTEEVAPKSKRKKIVRLIYRD